MAKFKKPSKGKDQIQFEEEIGGQMFTTREGIRVNPKTGGFEPTKKPERYD